MGVLRRIGKATRATLTDLTNRTFGSAANKELSQLTDAELEEELLRRRRERAARRGGSAAAPKGGVSPQEKQLAQFYANLELSPGATTEEIKTAYRELMRKYHPDKHVGDPERHRAATELAQSLTRAYQALLEHVGKNKK